MRGRQGWLRGDGVRGRRGALCGWGRDAMATHLPKVPDRQPRGPGLAEHNDQAMAGSCKSGLARRVRVTRVRLPRTVRRKAL